MTKLSKLRENVCLWEADIHLDEVFERAYLNDHDVWKKALMDNTILFSSGVDGQVKYESFRDIDFSGPEYNNQEWRAQLNRFFWMPHLAHLYCETRDERWAMMARDCIEHWIEYRPTVRTDTLSYAWEQCGDNCLSMSVRLGQTNMHGWFGSLPYFEGSKYFDDAFVDRMIASAKDQVVFMVNNLTKHGNFRISEANTLLFLAEVLPEDFGAYREFAVKVLNEAFVLQVEPDGSHCEHTIGYHTWMQRVFTEFAILSKRRPHLGLSFSLDTLFKMYDYELANYAPDGRTFGMNDSGRWHPDQKPADIAARIDYTNRLRAFFGCSPLEKIPVAFPDAGQYFFKHGTDALVLDATKYGSGHSHIVRGALLFYHGDRLTLCEPGSLNYDSSDPFFFYGRASAMHNTVTINNWYQLHTSNAAVPVWIDTDELSFAACQYSGGYMSDTPYFDRKKIANIQSCAGSHMRIVLWLKGEFAVVVDLIDAVLPEYDFAAHWQFLDEEVRLTENGMYTVSEGANLLITSPWCNHDIKAVKYRGDWDKMIGFISPDGSVIGSGAPAPMLSIEGRAEGFISPVRLLTVLAPFEGAAVPQVTADCTEKGGILRIKVTVNGETWQMAVDWSLIQGAVTDEAVEGDDDMKVDSRAAIVGPDGKRWTL